ncbi:MAG: acyl-CoA thioesterase [Kiritimatiellae bacterium]|nr:acyl-CoA thioesterase [Kiritimatiellia bacterium]
MQYRVPYADTDQMGVVYYANYLTYFERARNELLRGHGFSYKELEAIGIALPVREAKAKYLAPAHYDDELEILAWCSEFKGVRLTICCEVRCGGKLLVEGYTIHVCVNLKTLRPEKPPQAFVDAIGIRNEVLS